MTKLNETLTAVRDTFEKKGFTKNTKDKSIKFELPNQKEFQKVNLTPEIKPEVKLDTDSNLTSIVEKKDDNNLTSNFVKNEYREKLAKETLKKSAILPKFILTQLLSGFVAGNLPIELSAMISEHYAKIPTTELYNLRNILSPPAPEESNRINNKEKYKKEKEEEAAMIAYLPKFIFDLFLNGKLPFYLIARYYLLPAKLLAQYYDELHDGNNNEVQQSKSGGQANVKENYPDIRRVISEIAYLQVKAICDEINNNKELCYKVEYKENKNGSKTVNFADKNAPNDQLLKLNIVSIGQIEIESQAVLEKKTEKEIKELSKGMEKISIASAIFGILHQVVKEAFIPGSKQEILYATQMEDIGKSSLKNYRMEFVGVVISKKSEEQKQDVSSRIENAWNDVVKIASCFNLRKINKTYDGEDVEKMDSWIIEMGACINSCRKDNKGGKNIDSRLIDIEEQIKQVQDGGGKFNLKSTIPTPFSTSLRMR